MRVLLVEDDTRMADVVRRGLESENIAVDVMGDQVGELTSRSTAGRG